MRTFPNRRLSILLSTAAALLLALLLPALIPAATAAPAAAFPAGSQYVALGDSYAAGYGIGTSTGEPVPGCAQSTQDYPHQVASALNLKLTDVSCSGAVTADIDTTPQATPAGTAPRQDAALSPATKLVTVTIGGNDLGFSDISTYCLTGSADGPLALHPQFQNCKAHYAPSGGTDSLAARVSKVVVPRVKRVLADIHAKAPNAAVFFVDYPAISTTKAGSPHPATYPDSCFSRVTNPNSFPFTGIDTEYLQTVQANLNHTLSTLIATAGDTFVEGYPQSLAHSACTGTPQPWMNGITFDPNTGGPAAGSLHPNLVGATQLAGDALAAIRAYVAPTPSTSASTGPSSVSSSASAVRSVVVLPNITSTTVPLADTGAHDSSPLFGAAVLMLLGGTALLVAVRRRPRAGSHRG